MHSLAKKTVLLVAEDEHGCRAFREPLSAQGCEILESRSGADAFELVKNRKIDLIISDVTMADGDGLRLLADVRRVNHDLPVLLVRDPRAQLNPNEAFHQGASALLRLPIAPDALVNLVVRQLEYVQERLKKKKERIAVAATVDLDFTGAPPRRATVMNLSRIGMFVALDRDFPPLQAVVPFRLRLEDGENTPEITGEAVVRWVREAPQAGMLAGAGFEFPALSPDSERVLYEYLDRKTTKRS